jgi:hypothetical protein
MVFRSQSKHEVHVWIILYLLEPDILRTIKQGLKASLRIPPIGLGSVLYHLLRLRRNNLNVGRYGTNRGS